MTLMKKTFLPLLLLASLIFTGCSSTAKKTGGSSDSASVTSGIELNGSSDESTAGPLKSVFFAFDSSALSSSARETLEQNAQWLKLTDKVDIQVEGHCDERGGHQYNIALGERRARAIKEYLVALGVSESRVSIISYGKERPVSFGHDEGSWSQNRRGNFVITAK